MIIKSHNKKGFGGGAYAIAICLALLFVVFSYYYSINIKIVSDTEQYYEHFLELNEEPFPFGYEFFISFVMYFTKALGGDFFNFIFLNYLLWLPLIFFLSLRLHGRPEFFFIIIFFFSHYFFNNAAFLVRQFEASVLFIYFISFSLRWWRLGLLVISIGAHFHALLLLIFSFHFFVRIIFHPATRFILLFLILFIWIYRFDFGAFVVEFLSFHFSGLGLEFDRKLIGMTVNLGDDFYTISPFISFINGGLVVGLLALGAPKGATDQEKSIMSICLSSGILFFLFMQNPLLANRVSFVSYFLSVPALVYCASVIYRKNSYFHSSVACAGAD